MMMPMQMVLSVILVVGVLPASHEQVCVGCPIGKPEPKTSIADGDWSVSVVLGEGVSKPEAETIVRAFHRGELVDKHRRFPSDTAAASYAPEPARAGSIGRIAMSSPSTFRQPDEPGRFLVVTIYNANGFSGYEYLVTIRDGRVELRASLHFTA